MELLKYTFKTDTLFKMIFSKYQELLRKLVAVLLGISLDSIEQFEVRNPDIQPETLGDKFCRLDIAMTVNGQRIVLEIQVENEKNYPDRSLYYWARDFSVALGEGKDYIELPRTILINILNFNLFECDEFHSEFQTLEVTRHTPLSDKMSLQYFELLKIPKEIEKENELLLWLSLFAANTEEDFKRLEALEVPDMEQAIGAYRSVSATDEFKEIERLRSKARHDEAAALNHATEKERKKWEGIVNKKDAMISMKDAMISEKDAALSKKDDVISEKDILISQLQAELASLQSNVK